MALSSRLKLWEQKIKEEKFPLDASAQNQTSASGSTVASAVPGGFLKQLVRETEKETKHREPETRDTERVPSKLSDNLVQNFLLPDQTPSILEAGQMLNAENKMKRVKSPEAIHPKTCSSPKSDTSKSSEPALQEQEVKLPKQEVELLKQKVNGVREEPEGQISVADIREEPTLPLVGKDVWYEAGAVWYSHKDGYTLATELKPDEGTLELPEGRVRVQLQSDGSIHDVSVYDIEKLNPPELDLCEDLSDLVSVNECSVLHTLCSRAKAHQPLTRAGPNLLALWPPVSSSSKGSRGRRGDIGEGSGPLQALARRVYVSMVCERRDQSLVALGRSGSGKSSLCQAFTLELIRQARSAGGNLSLERVQAAFTVLRSFSCISSSLSEASSRVAVVLSIDFNHAGHAAAAHFQTMLLEKWSVCRTAAEGENSFLVFSQMLSGLSTELRTELQLHQLKEHNSFGITCPTKLEEKQRAAAGFMKLQSAMNTLGFSPEEQKAIWRVLAGIYHLGVAGTCKVGRRQFLSVESAHTAALMLGCDGEELHTAVFKHHLRELLQRATSGARERSAPEHMQDGPKLTGAQCVEGMAAGLYEELFTAVVSLINRALCSQQLSLSSVSVVDAPGFSSPKLRSAEGAAGFSDLCRNYLQERLLELYSMHTFTHTLQRYTQEAVSVDFMPPESSPSEVVCALDHPGLQVRGSESDPRGLLWVLDEEISTPGSSESTLLQRVCQHFSHSVRECEQPLQCEISHLMGSEPVRYDLSGWFSLVQNNPSVLNASQLLQNSSNVCVRSLFARGASAPPVCRGVGGIEGAVSQRCLQRNTAVRKTLNTGPAALRRHSQAVAIKLQADALLSVIRRSRPVFLQCVSLRNDGGGADVPALRKQLSYTHVMAALQLYRTGFPEHMSLSDFRCRFQALSPPVMKRYGSVFITPDEKKAVEELLTDLDLDKKSVVLGASRVLMKRGVLFSLNEQRDALVLEWLLYLQASCRGHLGRLRYRRMKVEQMAMRCIQRNLRILSSVSGWSWWKLINRVRPMLSVNMDEQRLRVKEDEISALRRRLGKSEKDRTELRQTVENLESKVTAVVSELSDERFRADAVTQALDAERTERLRLSRENKELQSRVEQSRVCLETLEKQLEEEKQKLKSREALNSAATESELQLQLDCAQTEVEFLRRRLQQNEDRLEAEKLSLQLLDTKVQDLQAQLDQSKRSVVDLKRHCRRLTSDLQDARVLSDTLQGRAHDINRKQRRFDSELTQALKQVDSEREQKDRAIHENTALCAEILGFRKTLKEAQSQVDLLQEQNQELSSQVQDLRPTPQIHPADSSVPELKKQLREMERREKERCEEISKMNSQITHTQQMHVRFELEMERMKQIHQKELEDKDEELEDVHKSSQRRLRQLEMQLEQEYEEKQMVIHEKHDLEGLIATLCEQVGHRDFEVEKRLRRDLKRTHALLSDAQLLLSTVEPAGHRVEPGAFSEQLERLRSQMEDSEARCLEADTVQKTLSAELENAQTELENICRQKSLADEQLAQLHFERSDLMKRLEEDQEDLNELMKKHKALIAQSSSDISQIRELQAELEELKKQRQTLQEQLQTSAARVQFLESSTVARSIVSKQEARICDLENKLEFQRGQVKRFEVLVLRLRDSVVRLGEELEQSTEGEARERENCKYYRERLEETRIELEEQSERERESSRRRLELEQQVEELSAVRQTLQADLETSIRRIVDLQAALEDESSDEESDDDAESAQTAVESFSRRKDLDSMSSVGSSLGAEDIGEGIRRWAGVSRERRSPSTENSDTASTYSFRSCTQDLDEDVKEERSSTLVRSSSSSALSELLDGLRRKRSTLGRLHEAGESSVISLPTLQNPGASTLRRQPSALSMDTREEDLSPVGILKAYSIPNLPRSVSLRSNDTNSGKMNQLGSYDSTADASAGKMNRFSSYDSVTNPSSVNDTNSVQTNRFSSYDTSTDASSGKGNRFSSNVSLASSASSRQIFSAVSIPEEPEEDTHPHNMPVLGAHQPMRRRFLGGLVPEYSEMSLGVESLVFQNRRLPVNQDSEKREEAEITPAIRRAQSTSSLASTGSRTGQRRALSVHFGELPPSRASRRESESDSTSSGGSQECSVAQGERLEAEGSEDLSSVMKKYLKKADAH